MITVTDLDTIWVEVNVTGEKCFLPAEIETANKYDPLSGWCDFE